MRVLISGAGVAGPTLAWFLAKTGARITVVEKTESILPYGQNVDLQGTSAVSVIKKMGLMDEVRKNNTTEKGTQFINSKGQPFAPFPVKEGALGSFTSEFEILRADLAKILYEASKDLPNVQYLFGTTIKEVISNDDDSVKVEFSDSNVEEFDLLVAADGQWSKVRRQCFPAEDVKSIQTGMYAIYYTIPRLPIDNDWWNVYFGLRRKIVTLRPDPYGTIRAMFTCMPCTDEQKKTWLGLARSGKKAQGELLRSEFANVGWQADRLLKAMEEAPDFYFHVIEQIKMKKWSKSRIICLGDAAYAPSPLTGMGTSLAITGAYVLAGELSKLGDGEHPSKAFEAYESTFRPFVEEQQKIPFVFPGMAHPRVAWQRWLLQVFVTLLSKLVATPWIVNMLRTENEEDFKLTEYPKLNDEDPK